MLEHRVLFSLLIFFVSAAVAQVTYTAYSPLTSAVTYYGTWSAADSNYDPDDRLGCYTDGASAAITTTGSAFAIRAGTNVDGQYIISLDGVATTVRNSRTLVDGSKGIIWESGLVTPGQHQITISMDDVVFPGGARSCFIFDAYLKVPLPTTTSNLAPTTSVVIATTTITTTATSSTTPGPVAIITSSPITRVTIDSSPGSGASTSASVFTQSSGGGSGNGGAISAGIIAGGLVGAVCLIAALVIFACFVRRRSRKKLQTEAGERSDLDEEDKHVADDHITPYPSPQPLPGHFVRPLSVVSHSSSAPTTAGFGALTAAGRFSTHDGASDAGAAARSSSQGSYAAGQQYHFAEVTDRNSYAGGHSPQPLSTHAETPALLSSPPTMTVNTNNTLQAVASPASPFVNASRPYPLPTPPSQTTSALGEDAGLSAALSKLAEVRQVRLHNADSTDDAPAGSRFSQALDAGPVQPVQSVAMPTELPPMYGQWQGQQ